MIVKYSDHIAPGRWNRYDIRGGWVATCISLIIGFLFSLLPMSGYAEEVIGSVKSAAGPAQIERQGSSLDAKVGDRLFQSDVLTTGADGQISVVLRDDTLISLGPSSVVALNEFEFKPQANQFALLIEVFKGVAAFVTGEIAKLSPEAVSVVTPDGSIGVRGTRFAVQIKSSKLN